MTKEIQVATTSWTDLTPLPGLLDINHTRICHQFLKLTPLHLPLYLPQWLFTAPYLSRSSLEWRGGKKGGGVRCPNATDSPFEGLFRLCDLTLMYYTVHCIVYNVVICFNLKIKL